MVCHIAIAPILSKSRADTVADVLRTAILRGDIDGGQPLNERDLADELGVSKTPVREALRSLASTGLVTTTPFRGAAVRRADQALAKDVYGVRILLEPGAISAAVGSQTTERLAEASALLGSARHAGRNGDLPTMGLLNREFHRLLYEPNGNTLLTSVLDGLQDQVALVSTQAWRRRKSWSDEAREHEAMLKAVMSRDARTAARLAREHIERALQTVLAVLPKVL